MDPPRKGYRLIVDFKSQFPEKLYDVANDGYLIYWNKNGSISIKDEDEFEKNVMRLYPGFLQIPSFLNFKRLFREYGFDRMVNENNVYEFSHPYFIQGRRDLTKNILTRRKSMRYPVNYDRDEPVVIEAEEGKRYSTRKRKRTTTFNPNVPPTQVNHDSGHEGQGDGCKTYIISHTDMKRYPVAKPNLINDPDNSKQTDTATPSASSTSRIDKKDLRSMMESFAEKEYTDDEYAEWLAKKRKEDKIKKEITEDIDDDNTKPKDSRNWWLFEDKDSGDGNDSTKDVRQIVPDHCMPCGFCKCCSAITNYVHIFGEIPENIQVFDYMVEVPQEPKVIDAEDLSVDNEVIIEIQ